MVAGVTRSLFWPGPVGDPRLEALDLGTPDVANPLYRRVFRGEVAGERAKRQVGPADAARSQDARDLGQVGPHRSHDLRVGRL